MTQRTGNVTGIVTETDSGTSNRGIKGKADYRMYIKEEIS